MLKNIPFFFVFHVLTERMLPLFRSFKHVLSCHDTMAKLRVRKQGRIHGQHELRSGGQGRKCAFSHSLTRGHRLTDRRMDKGSYRVACPQLKTMLDTHLPLLLFLFFLILVVQVVNIFFMFSFVIT